MYSVTQNKDSSPPCSNNHTLTLSHHHGTLVGTLHVGEVDAHGVGQGGRHQRGHGTLGGGILRLEGKGESVPSAIAAHTIYNSWFIRPNKHSNHLANQINHL